MATMTSHSMVRTSEKRPRNRKALKVGGGVLFCLASLLSLLWYMGVFGGNVRTVEEGRVYRSAAITGDTLETVLKEKGIKTLLNLRGGSDKDEWHRSETASAAKFGAKHIDVSLSAVRFPPPPELDKILDTFDHAAYPILFHCRGGADRSGLAGTLYLALYKGVPLDEAQHEQLTWRYGHLSFGQAHAMDDFFTLYRKTGKGTDLREWIKTKYPALHAKLPAKQKVEGYNLARE